MEMAKQVTYKNETVTIRPYDPAKDLDSVLGLWQAAFNKQMPASVWRWKYLENPYELAMLICENEKGVPVVFYGGVPFSANNDGNTRVMIYLGDIMSHPDYRGSGLFIHTANAYFDTFGSREKTLLMYGFPGKYHFDIGAKYLEYRTIGDGAAYLTGACQTILQHVSGSGGRMAQLFGPEPCMDELWEICRPDYPLSVIRNRSYMTWRFFKNPQHAYQVWGYFETVDGREECRGWMVITIQKDKAVIVDMLVSESEVLVLDFLEKIAHMLLENRITRVETWFPKHHFMTRMFEAGGFEQKKEPIGIIPTIRMFDDSIAYDLACDRIYYTMADGDLF